ncbi:MAG: MFS transporter [Phycisphaerae bacterium]|nr:MFS transporter [Phycisphaerae bacterium]
MRLNPFAGLPNSRQVWAWGMYDLANQSFTLLVVTLFLPIYLKQIVLGAAAPAGHAEALLGWTTAAASLVVVLSNPVLGALADFSGKKKLFLTWTGIGCAAFTVGLAFTEPGNPWPTLGLFALGSILFMFGESFLASFLPEISTRETVGRISAIGWTMGYIGALACLPLSLLLPGLSEGTRAGFSNVFLFAGLWFFVNALPTIFLLNEKKTRETLPPGATIVNIGFHRVAQTIRNASQHRELAVFLLFFCVYCCGMQIIIGFSGLLASQYFTNTQLIVFVLALAFISAVGSAISGLYQDRIGQRRTVQISLAIWIATTAAAVFLPTANAAMWHLALVGAGIGLGLGLTGAASRALVGVLTPAHKTAEFFSLWGLGYRLAGVIGPPIFGEVTHRYGQPAAMGVVVAFFIVGFAGTYLVNVEKGRRAAEESERAFASA